VLGLVAHRLLAARRRGVLLRVVLRERRVLAGTLVLPAVSGRDGVNRRSGHPILPSMGQVV
jgi:hypothetical protein